MPFASTTWTVTVGTFDMLSIRHVAEIEEGGVWTGYLDKNDIMGTLVCLCGNKTLKQEEVDLIADKGTPRRAPWLSAGLSWPACSLGRG